MTISETKIYPRTGDKQTVYLKSVVKKGQSFFSWD